MDLELGYGHSQKWKRVLGLKGQPMKAVAVPVRPYSCVLCSQLCALPSLSCNEKRDLGAEWTMYKQSHVEISGIIICADCRPSHPKLRINSYRVLCSQLCALPSLSCNEKRDLGAEWTMYKQSHVEISGIIICADCRPSHPKLRINSYRVPIQAVPKPDGTWRLVTNFKALNKVTVPDTRYLINCSETSGDIGRDKEWLSKLDLANGY